jgi:hypothetical protein
VSRIQGPSAAVQLLGASAPEAAVSTVSRRWAESDPEAALGWAMSLSDSLARNTATSSIYSTWANSDFDSAMSSARSGLDGELREQVLVVVCAGHPGAAGCD